MAEYSFRERSFFLVQNFSIDRQKNILFVEWKRKQFIIEKMEIKDLKEVEKNLDEEVDDSLKMK